MLHLNARLGIRGFEVSGRRVNKAIWGFGMLLSVMLAAAGCGGGSVTRLFKN
jgi:hypothetical protein